MATPHVEVLTVEVRGSGAPLVMVPGFACSPAVWFKVLDTLAQTWEVHAVTVPGFGGAPPVPPPVSPKVRDALGDYCASLGGAAMVGHSYGAFLSLWAAATRPDAVTAVVAVDGLPYFPAIFDLAATPATMRDRAEQQRAEIAAGGGDYSPPGATYFDQHIIDPDDASYLNQASPRSDAHAMGDIRYEILTTDIRPETANIKCPVQYIAAGKPWIKEPDDVVALSEFYLDRIGEIADLEFVIAEAARHFVMVDDPEFFLEVVCRFLAKIAR